MAVGNNINQLYKYTDNTGKTHTVNPASSGGYMDAYSQYETDRTNQLNTSKENLDKTLEQNNATTNSNYDNSARQAYVDYMRKQKALPGQLQSLGVRGGATESGQLNLYNNYGSSHAANEQQRNADLTTNQQNRDDAYNSAYQEYLSDLNTQKQQAISNQINEYNNEVTRFSSSVAQYPSTAAGYKAYQQWINNMQASSDPLKDIKVALIRQQMASQFPNGSPSSGGSGSGGGRSYGRSSSSSSGSSGTTKSALQTAYANSASGALAGKVIKGIARGAINKVTNSNKSSNKSSGKVKTGWRSPYAAM